MDWRRIAREAEGLHTVKSLAKSMGIKESTAVLYIHGMRKAGYVRTTRGRRGKRLYDVSPLRLRKVGSEGFIEILNRNSSLKIQRPFSQRVYGKRISMEEALIRALKSDDPRIVLASIGLFRKQLDWKRVYSLAKKEGLEREVGSMYEMSRSCFKVRRMDGRIRRKLMDSPVRKDFIIRRVRRSEFGDIEKIWGIRIPFRKSEIEGLR
jgi:hypothetical protein